MPPSDAFDDPHPSRTATNHLDRDQKSPQHLSLLEHICAGRRTDRSETVFPNFGRRRGMPIEPIGLFRPPRARRLPGVREPVFPIGMGFSVNRHRICHNPSGGVPRSFREEFGCGQASSNRSQLCQLGLPCGRDPTRHDLSALQFLYDLAYNIELSAFAYTDDIYAIAYAEAWRLP